MATDDERRHQPAQGSDPRGTDRLRHVLESAASINFKLDLKGRRIAAFGSMPPWLDGPSERRGALLDLFSSVHPDDEQRFSLDALSALPPGDVREGTFRVVLDDGSIPRIRARIRLLRDAEGVPQTLFGVLSDVTPVAQPSDHDDTIGSTPGRRRGERQHDERRAQLESAMRHGIRAGEFHVEYQAVVDVWTGEATAAEALARWRHPELGVVTPDEFIPVAEQSGLIVPLGSWVLRRACLDMAGWGDAASDLTLCVNVSGRQLAGAGIDAAVAATLDEARLDSSRLCVEITESVLVDDAQATAAALRRLRDLGVSIAIDDFGTGYSSLLYLREFPAQILKIDRRFVAGVAGGLEDLAIVRATIELAHALGLVALAEGVETAEQLTILRTLGCDLAQGFLWARPLPAEDFVAMLESRSAFRVDLPEVQSARSALSLRSQS